MYRIAKTFSFSASHVIEGLPTGHPCGRVHGHNYVVTLELARPDLDGVGFVRDFGDLADVKSWLDARCDHRHLNDVLPLGVPTTCEAIARWIFDEWIEGLPELVAVRVSETARTWGEYRP